MKKLKLSSSLVTFLLILVIHKCTCYDQNFYSLRDTDNLAEFYAEEPDIVKLLFHYITPYGPNVSEACNNASQKYIDTLNQPLTLLQKEEQWAYKMYDASAKIPRTGLIEGHQHFPGNFESCLEIAASEFNGKHCLSLGLPDFSIFETKGEEIEARQKIKDFYYKMSYHPGNRGIQGFLQLIQNGFIILGRCIPSVCTEEDLAFGWQNFIDEIMSSLQIPLEKPPLNFIPLNCHTADETISLTAADKGMIAVIAIFGVLIGIGTIADCLVNVFNIDIVPDKFLQYSQGFSAYSNTLKLFNTRSSGSDSLSCINGIRFLSITWVIIGHVYSSMGPYGAQMANNLMIYRDWIKDVEFNAVLNAFPSVDTFFLIGATLLTYLTLKELDKTNGGGAVFWIKFYVHRYIRLTGVYAVILFFHATLLKYFATGPASFGMKYNQEYCQDYWYKNLLYVNNLWEPELGGCLGQTWYLGNDMQFFIISPIIIWSLWKSPKLGLIFSGVLTVIATAIPIAISWINDFPISPMFPDPSGRYMNDFYIVPWCRFQPYIIGIVLGYTLHKLKNKKKLEMNSILSLWIWAIAFVVGCSVIYGLAHLQKNYFDFTYVYPLADRVAYNGLHRLAWSLAISWVILACVKGQGGPVNSLLSWRAWAPLARMSYCMYLVHMTVISYYMSLSSYTVTLSHPFIIYYILWVTAVSAAVSYVCVIGFEMPIAHLEKLLFAALGVTKLPQAKKVDHVSEKKD